MQLWRESEGYFFTLSYFWYFFNIFSSSQKTKAYHTFQEDVKQGQDEENNYIPNETMSEDIFLPNHPRPPFQTERTLVRTCRAQQRTQSQQIRVNCTVDWRKFHRRKIASARMTHLPDCASPMKRNCGWCALWERPPQCWSNSKLRLNVKSIVKEREHNSQH